jgi:glycosyltransferase involved in cell wall biosynthesis
MKTKAMRNILLEMEKLRNPNSGLGQFCMHLGKELAAISAKELKLNFYLPEAGKGMFGDEHAYITHSQLHKVLPASRQMDVWHCMHQGSKYLPSSRNTKLILTIHDLNFLHKYSGIKRKLHLDTLQRKVKKASAITFISKYTEGICKENLRLPDVTTKVIYNGNSLEQYPEAARPWFAPTGKFIFTLGIISPKKNFHTLISLLKELKDTRLIIAGNDAGAYANEIQELARKAGVSERLVMPGIINDEEKYWLYRNCEAFVFPSLAEGFGLPVVEAMSCGKPVFLAASSSLPEIGGDAAFYWNNFNAGEMRMVFEKGMKEFHKDGSNAKRCIERAALFSWKKAAAEYSALYRSV